MNLLFTSSLDASGYIGGAGMVKGAKIRTVDYDTNTVRFVLINDDDSVRSEVNGITGTAPFDESTDFAALIASVVSGASPSP